MIYLEQGQKVFDRPELVVYEPTGERNDADMVICAEAKNPSEPFCWLEAQYIAYGGVVYKISDDKELETEILKMDPDSTFSELAVDPVATLEDPSLRINDPIQEVQIQPSAVPEAVAPVESTPIIPSSPKVGVPVSETSTSSAPFVPEAIPVADPASTSTTPVLELVDEPTITLPVEPIVEVVPVVTPPAEPVVETPVVETIIEPVISYIKKRVRKSLS